mgnify:CR=1 FL=1
MSADIISQMQEQYKTVNPPHPPTPHPPHHTGGPQIWGMGPQIFRPAGQNRVFGVFYEQYKQLLVLK